MATCRIGPIVQIAYVVPDLHATVRYWVSDLGVDPFYVFEQSQYKELVVGGVPSKADASLAFAYSGETNTELIEQHNTELSVFREFSGSPGNGMHHVEVFSTALTGDEAHLVASGMRRMQRNVSVRGSETVLLHGPSAFAGLLELVHYNDVVASLFKEIKESVGALGRRYGLRVVETTGQSVARTTKRIGDIE